MQRRIRITAPERTFFISDPHFNHDHPAILAAAGVTSVDELNAKRIALWNDAVPADGVVFMLGDFCLHDPSGQCTRDILKQLHGREIHLLWGNHNSGVKNLYREQLARQFFPGRERHADHYEVYPLRFSLGRDRQIIFVGDYQVVVWRRDGVDHKIILSHFAFRNWWHSEKGAWMLCGHSHGDDRPIASFADEGIGRIQEVTFEAVGRPRNLLELDTILSAKALREHHRISDSGNDDD